MSDINENTDGLLTEQDQADLAQLAAEPLEITVLETWESVLSNIEQMENEKIEPSYAVNIVGKWPKLDYGDVPHFYKLFNEYLKRYRAVLEEQLRLHPDAKDNTGELGTEESDAVANRDIYIELMFGWNVVTAELEHEWDALDVDAAEKIAAMGEAQLFVTGPQGMLQALTAPNVGFQWTNEEQIALTERVVAAAEEL
ncbi:hypothetical protein SEA_DOTI_44 [Microbacterium phage DoTi]|nr:hypothetical protein SEA_DOTI_44 [Microbacterium phage DoTi]